MDWTQLYALVAAGTFSMFVLVHFRKYLNHVVNYLFLLSRYLTYPRLVHRHRFLGPWSPVVVIMQLVYIAANIFCVTFPASSIAEIGRRAGTLAVINMVPLFAGPHFAFLEDILGTSLATIHLIHRSAGIMTFSLSIVHALVIAESRVSLLLDLPPNLFAVVSHGGSSLCLLILLTVPIFRRLSYELFLRTHQALATATAYSLWRHLPSKEAFPLVYVYISAGLFSVLLLVQIILIVHRNGIFRYHLSRATITDCHGAVHLRIRHQKGSKIDSGQYINLWIPWMPFVSFWSLLQTHPFMVISWTPGKQDTIELFVQPRRGLTRKLLYHAANGHLRNPVVIFSGPHGTSIAMDEYESVLMVASGFGIAAHLSSLKKLIYGYNARLGPDGIGAQSFLNNALEEDKLDDGRILLITIHLESHDIVIPFGKRATVYPGPAPLSRIFLEEVSGENINQPEKQKVQQDPSTADSGEPERLRKPRLIESGQTKDTTRDGKMLVMGKQL
ncbi:related to FRE2 Ferric (and cupric) reductase [Rhynchosporium graminicola]|uniref:Related to FRE2 Ferric (And cupric) reductase n=1 Tax=Rhynchosporium graminicola TaxID=2792576 RepID=A0A1E1LB44_9HELO|nr:related to FRE2 Ferric (and cupric) reductase [Rhynchosporium commune]